MLTMAIPLDLDAFCYQEYPRLVGTLSLFCGDTNLAEEFAQEALARACADWSKVRDMAAPGPWVNTVALNLARSHFRRRLIERRVAPRLAEREATTPPDVDTVVAVRTAVSTLPVRQRTALVLRYYVGLSVYETAEAMHCPAGTVKRLTHRAISSLRRSHFTEALKAVGDVD